jgi:hypothetical protein
MNSRHAVLKKQVKHLRRKETMKLRVLLVVMCVGLLVVPAAFAEMTPTLDLAGDVETNSTIYGDSSEVLTGDAISTLILEQDGRVRLSIDGRLESDTGMYAAASGDSMLGMNGIASVDDAWIEVGKDNFGVRVGRYEAESLYGLGNDILIVTPRNIPGAYYQGRYEGNYARGRFSSGIDNISLIWSGETNYFELGFVYGGISATGPVLITTTDPDTGVPIQQIVDLAFGFNAIGFRPVYRWTGDTIQFRIGFDSLFEWPQEDKIVTEDYAGDNKAALNLIGGAGDIQWSFGAGTLGLSLAYGLRSGQTVDGSDRDDVSQLGGFLWMTFPVREADELGIGVGYQTQDTEYNIGELTGLTDSGQNFGGYVSYIQQLSVESLKIKYAGSFAQTTAQPDIGEDFSSTRWGFRVRMNYDF